MDTNIEILIYNNVKLITNLKIFFIDVFEKYQL